MTKRLLYLYYVKIDIVLQDLHNDVVGLKRLGDFLTPALC